MKWCQQLDIDHWSNDRLLVVVFVSFISCGSQIVTQEMNEETNVNERSNLVDPSITGSMERQAIVIYFFFGPNETNVGSKVNEINM